MSSIDSRIPCDSSFERFVHNPTFIRHLLRAHPLQDIGEAEVVALDPASAHLVGRDVPATWHLRLADGSPVYLLLECQSQVDPRMPFRMLHAVATLCGYDQDCVWRGAARPATSRHG